jgi:oxygen-independent coproporphyrinogen-3 oxidase
MAIMCQGRVDFEPLECAHLVQFNNYFAPELERLKTFEARGLLEIEPGGLQVTPQGWYFVRAIAMTFDKYLQTEVDRSRFSRII